MAIDCKKTYQEMSLGQLFMATCDFDQAISEFQKGLKQAIQDENWAVYTKIMVPLLRIYAERLEFDRINDIHFQLKELSQHHSIPTSSMTHYVLGICFLYQKDPERSYDHFSQAIQLAEADGDKKTLCFAKYGMANFFTKMRGDNETAFNILKELDFLLEETPLSEVKFSSQILKNVIYRKLERFEEALKELEALSAHRRGGYNGYSTLNLLYAYGALYHEWGRKDLAVSYLRLVDSLVDRTNLKHLDIQIQERLEALIRSEKCVDLVLTESDTNTLVEKSKGNIPVQNQFLLINLLKLFAEVPGRVYSKSEIVEKIWKETYESSRHDNKLYVTIQRLRKLIEPDAKIPSYVISKEGGYCFNINKKILIQLQTKERSR